MAASEDVAIMGENGALLAPGEIGEVVARGASVFTHYLGDAALTAEAFRNGWFCTGDLGVLDDNRFLTIKGYLANLRG